MRKLLTVVSLLTAMLAFGAAPALASGVPTNCHDLNRLLHIDNVKDCDNGS